MHSEEYLEELKNKILTLPPDIQKRLIYETSLNLSSKKYYDYSQEERRKDICSLPITYKEVKNYVVNNPQSAEFILTFPARGPHETIITESSLYSPTKREITKFSFVEDYLSPTSELLSEKSTSLKYQVKGKSIVSGGCPVNRMIYLLPKDLDKLLDDRNCDKYKDHSLIRKYVEHYAFNLPRRSAFVYLALILTEENIPLPEFTDNFIGDCLKLLFD